MGVPVAPMLERANKGFNSRIRKLSATIGHADLTAATNGLEQDILLGALPAGAIVIGSSFKITTYFTGGSATAVTMALGTGASGVPAAIQTAVNVFDTTTTGVWLKGTAGVSAVGPFGGASIYAQFDCDASHTLAGLTAGAIDVEVYYTVPDAA